MHTDSKEQSSRALQCFSCFTEIVQLHEQKSGVFNHTKAEVCLIQKKASSFGM